MHLPDTKTRFFLVSYSRASSHIRTHAIDGAGAVLNWDHRRCIHLASPDHWGDLVLKVWSRTDNNGDDPNHDVLVGTACVELVLSSPWQIYAFALASCLIFYIHPVSPSRLHCRPACLSCAAGTMFSTRAECGKDSSKCGWCPWPARRQLSLLPMRIAPKVERHITIGHLPLRLH